MTMMANTAPQRKRRGIHSAQYSIRSMTRTSTTNRACTYFQLLQCLLLFSVASSLSTWTQPTTPRRAAPRQRQKERVVTPTTTTMPDVSPATGLVNHMYSWKHGQSLRYQVAGPANGQPIILVHGLFCNADHWRKSLRDLSTAGCRIYALDLLGCGYSDKPAADSAVAAAVNGELSRFDGILQSEVAESVSLGTANGKGQRVRDVPLRHPLKSPYNMYTWSDCVSDFCRDICLANNHDDEDKTLSPKAVLVGNSKGTVVALQAAMDHPELFSGVFCVTPTFRELHAAEIPASAMAVVRGIQHLLRRTAVGQAIFNAAAVPSVVHQLLEEPYAAKEQVDDELVQVLLDPLLTTGACSVLLDTLSYSAGPVPEQQLADPTFPKDMPVWIGYGESDPWTPVLRVQALQEKFANVERVQGWVGVGHCPHDEAPDAVHSMLLEFLQRLQLQQQPAIIS